MYLPEQYAERRVEVLHALVRAHPLGALVTLTADGLEASHIPFEIDPDPPPLGTLRGHVARANPLWRTFSPDVEALVIFHGPDEYVSPSWYPSKGKTGRVVPTWNYAVVHASGPLRPIEDRAWLRAHVGRLTDRHEAGRADPWKVTDAPGDFVDRMVDAIVGIEVPLTRLLGKWKVSQNRPAEDRAGVVEALAGADRDSARAMSALVRAASDGS